MTMPPDCDSISDARALWYTGEGCAEIRSAPLKRPGPGEALVATLFSGISRGTERLVFDGRVGDDEKERMRAPFQEGAFPFPVKYGYAATGIVSQSNSALDGAHVFCLHPHQDRFVARTNTLVRIPPGIPAQRATLAANMETALNAVWDAGAGPSDRIVVVGAGVVGLLVAYLAAAIPGTQVQVTDTDESREALVTALGAQFAREGQLESSADIVFHTTATPGGLETAIAAAGFEAKIVELSWYGDGTIPVALGGAFHSQRLTILSSQVGHVAPSHRARFTHRRRLMSALCLLDNPVLDQLVAETIPFEDAPELLAGILCGEARGLAPVICYSNHVPAES